MDNEARLARALAASGAPSRDPAFTLSVMRAAERERYGLALAQAILRTAGLAAAAAGLGVWFIGWAASNAEAFQTGLLGAASLTLLVAGARLLSARVTAVLRT
jgi:hypothetical protein